MVIGSTPSEQGKRVNMAGKSPRGNDTKKAAKLSLKDKRAQKREKSETTPFIKPRKGA